MRKSVKIFCAAVIVMTIALSIAVTVCRDREAIQTAQTSSVAVAEETPALVAPEAKSITNRRVMVVYHAESVIK